jgi:hypothetical protein
MERVHVDQIEGDRAVLLCGKDGREKLSIPARLLPAGIQEGAALDLTLAAAPEDNTKEAVQDLMGELFGDKTG